MIRSRRLVRASAPLLVSLAVALPALGLTGCRSKDVVGRGSAAVVDGQEISRADVLRLVDAQKRQLAKPGGNPAGLREIAGTGTDTVDAATFSYVLSELIRNKILEAAVRKGGVSSKGYVDQARKELANGPQGTIDLTTIDKGLVDLAVHGDALKLALGEVVKKETSPAERDRQVQKLYPLLRQSSPDCVSAIFSADELGSKAAKQSIDAGADFASVASQISTNAQSAQQGGFLGCTSPDQIQQQLNVDVSSLEAGAVVGPVQIPQGPNILLRLDSTTGPTLAQARPQIEQELDARGSGSDVLANRLAKLQRRANVQVDSRYGRWNPDSGIVDPPVGPLTTTTTAPAAPVPGGNP